MPQHPLSALLTDAGDPAATADTYADAVRDARLRVLDDPVDMFLSDLIAEFSVR